MAESTESAGPVTEERDEKLDFYYEGSDFPWFLRIAWFAFLIFMVVYVLKWMVPDLMAYLSNPMELLR